MCLQSLCWMPRRISAANSYRELPQAFLVEVCDADNVQMERSRVGRVPG